jgi:hypothetical protein
MPTLKLTDQQVTELIQQLPPAQQRSVLMSLAREAASRRQFRADKAESELRKLASLRGRNWELMSEEDRETFVDDLMHEETRCTS